MHLVWAYLRLSGCLVFTLYFLVFLYFAIKTGRIHHTDSVSVYVFRKEPLKYLLVFAIFTGFAGIFGCLTVWAFQDVLQNL